MIGKVSLVLIFLYYCQEIRKGFTNESSASYALFSQLNEKLPDMVFCKTL